jgi:hypothetical protein
MIAVGVMRFVMLGVRPRRPFHLDCGKSVIRSSVILAVTALIAGPVDIVASVEMRGFAAWALSNYLDVVPWIPLATASLRWLLSTGLFATAYLLIGTTVAAAVGQRGLLRTVLGRHPFRTALFFFLLYLSMIPLKIVLVYVVFDIADWRLGDSGAELAGLIFLFSLISTKFSLLETVLPAVAVANLFGAKPRPS